MSDRAPHIAPIANALAGALVGLPVVVLATVGLWIAAVASCEGGGKGAFDRNYERSVAAEVGQRRGRDALDHLVARWRPEDRWRRQLLPGRDQPLGFCAPALVDGDAGRAVLTLDCGKIEVRGVPAAGDATRPPRDLGDHALGKARWLAARALRMVGEHAQGLERVRITQRAERRFGPTAVHTTVLDVGGGAPPADVEAFVQHHLRVVENTATGLDPDPPALPPVPSGVPSPQQD